MKPNTFNHIYVARILVAVVSVVFLIGVAPLSHSADRTKKAETAKGIQYIVVDSTPVWKAAGDFYKVTKEKLSFGTAIEVVSTKDGWLKIQDTLSKTKGWLPSFLVTAVKSDIDRMRKANNVPKAVIGVLPKFVSPNSKRLYIDDDSFTMWNLLYTGPAFRSDLPFALANGERIEIEGVGRKGMHVADSSPFGHVRVVLDLTPGEAVVFLKDRGLEDVTLVVTGTKDGTAITKPREWQLYCLTETGVMETIP